MSVLRVILIKEFKQFFKNPFLPRIAVVFPLIVMLVMPLVTNLDVKHVGVAMVDQDHSQLSRLIAEDIEASEYTSVNGMFATYDDALQALEQGNADIILEIPFDFSASLVTRSPEKVNVSANSVNTIKGMLGMQYLQRILMKRIASAMHARGALGKTDVMKLSELNMFNPTLNFQHYMIPALMIMLIVMICGFLPALNIVGEKEIGTIEQINVSPVSQLTFILGKVIPYWVIGFVVLTIGIIVAKVVYQLSPVGNIALVYLASFLFIIVMSSLAAVIANFSNNMQQAMLIMFFFVMVFLLMSGMLTPISSMPDWAQCITYAMPPRFFVSILRATYLRGPSLADQSLDFTMLAAFAIVFTTVAIFTYRKRS